MDRGQHGNLFAVDDSHRSALWLGIHAAALFAAVACACAAGVGMGVVPSPQLRVLLRMVRHRLRLLHSSCTVVHRSEEVCR